MKVIAINASPRKTWNTFTLLNKALEGAKTKGAETEIINLYDLNYKGCISCFACKLKGGKSYGKCAVKDDLTNVFEKIENADALILGSPIYFGNVTGEMRSFMERLFFQYLVYDKERTVLFPKMIPTAFIYTMNVNEQNMKNIGYEQLFVNNENLMKRFFGASTYITANDTYQFVDYSKYVSTLFDPKEKLKHKNEVFPEDCKNAFELGIKLTEGICE